MYARKFLKWVNGPGSEYAVYAVAAAGITLTSITYLPNTLLIYKYKEFKENARKGKTVYLPTKLEQRFKECLNLVQVDMSQRKLIEPFCVAGLDLFHTGSLSSRYGAMIGIPEHFNYTNIEEISINNLNLNVKPEEHNSPKFDRLKEALITPEALQKFAISREIIMTQNNKYLIDSASPLISIFFSYTASQYFKARLRLNSKPLYSRVFLYSVVSLTGFAMYVCMKNKTQVYYERKADEKLVEMGFAEEGFGLCDRLLVRNRILSELCDNSGYSLNGNKRSLIFKGVNLTERREYFKSKMKNDSESLFEEL